MLIHCVKNETEMKYGLKRD